MAKRAEAQPSLYPIPWDLKACCIAGKVPWKTGRVLVMANKRLSREFIDGRIEVKHFDYRKQLEFLFSG